MDDDSRISKRATATRLLVGGVFAALVAFVVLLVYRVGLLSPAVEMPLMRLLAVVGWLGTAAAIFGTIRLYVLR